MQRGLFLDVVIGERAAIFKLLARKDQALLVRRNAFLVWKTCEQKKGYSRDRCLELTLDLGLDIVDGVGRFDLEGDGLTRQGLDENLHDGLVTKRQVLCTVFM